MSDWSARAKVQAARWASSAFPTFSNAALEISAEKFERGSIPHFFSSDVREIDPSLNDDLLELYGRAGQILANRFAFFNLPITFENGIDWEPSQPDHWRAELHACDYVLDLACTYRISREAKYARHLRYLVAHWIASNPPHHGSGWETQVLARRLRNWMLAADLARDDWEGDPNFLAIVTKSLALQSAFLLGHIDSLSSNASRLHGARALLCISRFFQGKQAEAAHDTAIHLLASTLDDSKQEPWPCSRLIVCQTLVECIVLSDSAKEQPFLAEALLSSMDELEAVLTPEGCLPLLGPQARLAQDELSDLSAMAAVKLKSPAWKSIDGKFGILPYLFLGEEGKRQFESLPETDWDPQFRADKNSEILRMVGGQNSGLMICAHVPNATKDHQDFTSYELLVAGLRVIVDSGGYAPDESKYFRNSLAHNVLLIDGLEPRWNSQDRPTRHGFEADDAGSWIRISDSDFAFLGVQHVRQWCRLESDAWLILDWLDGSGIHSCTSVLHFYPTFEVTAANESFQAKSRASSFAVIPVGDTMSTGSVSRGEDSKYPGWYSPEWGVKFPSATLALEWKEIELPRMCGVLIARSGQNQIDQVKMSATEGSVRVEFRGKTYDAKTQ